MILSMLYDVNFIIGLLITLVLVTLVSFYFTQRIEEQNEKIGAMSVVVQALVKGLTEVKNVQHGGGQQGVASVEPMQPQTIDLAALDEVNDLIEVSDDEEEEDEDMSHQTRSIHISESDVHDIDDVNDIHDINEDINDSSSDSEESDDSDDSDESDESEDEDDAFVEPQDIVPQADDSLKESELFADEILDLDEKVVYKTIHVSLDGSDDLLFSESSSYKKMSLSELRAIVLTKNLCADSSKMKKQQLYKLLGVKME